MNTGLCVLTGATGGIGQAIAKTLHGQGWQLLLVGRNSDALNTLSSQCPGSIVFVGDLTDSGSASNDVLRLVMSMVENEIALCVCGNHDSKLWKKLNGRNVQIKHGLAETLEQLATEPTEFVEAAKDFLGKLISHYVLDNGKLVIVGLF